MKKLLTVFLLILLAGCQKEVREDLFVLGIDGQEIVPGFDTQAVLEKAGIGFTEEGILQPKEEASGILYRDALPVGSYRLYNPEKKKERTFLDSPLVYLELYTDPFSLTLDGEVLSSSMKETCDAYKGEYLEHNGPYCVLKKESSKHYATMILHGDITDLDQDRLDRLEIFIDEK